MPDVAATASTSGKSDTQPSGHLHRRYFIGPQPEKAVTQAIKDESHGGLLKSHAIRALLTFESHHGSSSSLDLNTPADEPSRLRKKVIDDVWKQSTWGTYFVERKNAKHLPASTSKWVGESFRIGTIGQTGQTGYDFIEETEEELRDRMSLQSTRGSSVAKSFMSKLASAPTLAPIQTIQEHSHSEPIISLSQPVPPSTVGDEAATPTSITHLIDHGEGPSIPSDPLRPSIIKTALVKSDTNIQKAKRKAHFSESQKSIVATPPIPLPPSEVLERVGADVQQTSAGASLTPQPSLRVPHLDFGGEDNVILRDRMLVRVNYTKREDIGPHFDEQQMRSFTELRYENWGEFMVVWRQDRIELYEDYSFRAQEWVHGHKHLSYVIPLKPSTQADRSTTVSLFSFVDLTFCLTCRPTNASSLDPRRLFHREKPGTDIFVMKVKSRSRATDWVFRLWRYLGGRIPTSIDLVSPALESKVKIDIPDLDRVENDGLLGSTLSREKVIALCTEALMGHESWKALIGHQILNGKELELAWRVDTTLDWVWLDNDIAGDARAWAVVAGLAFRQSTISAQLEIRLGEHFPTYLFLEDKDRVHRPQRLLGPEGAQRPPTPEPTRRLDKPDSIEGYVDRIKPNTNVKQQLYLATHDGYLFSINPSHAHPPPPPVPPPPGVDIHTFAYRFRKSEVARGAHQLSHARAVCDLRSIAAVRRAFQPLPTAVHQHEEPEHEHPDWEEQWTSQEVVQDEDEQDVGGDEGLPEASEQKAHVKMRRSFELLFRSGQVTRFETYSSKTALEWINQLRALIFYWKHRHLVDAREEMDLATTRRERVTPRTHAYRDDEDFPPEKPPDLSAPMPALGTLYNWCVLEACKPILRGGKVYSRRGLRGQFKYVQLFLTRGEICRFRIATDAPFHYSTTKKISLVDAYVCSGYFAAIALPSGQYHPNAPTTARRYQDGLEADDPEEDLLFCLWYRSNTPSIDETIEAASTTEMGEDTTGGPVGSIPSLSAKRKMVVFRTRSKLERDAWCWAINCEIERLVRATKERETKLRMTGTLAPIPR